jgi:hypothetical protein
MSPPAHIRSAFPVWSTRNVTLARRSSFISAPARRGCCSGTLKAAPAPGIRKDSDPRPLRASRESSPGSAEPTASATRWQGAASGLWNGYSQYPSTPVQGHPVSPPCTGSVSQSGKVPARGWERTGQLVLAAEARAVVGPPVGWPAGAALPLAHPPDLLHPVLPVPRAPQRLALHHAPVGWLAGRLGGWGGAWVC